MDDRMPCHISDGSQEPGDIPYTDLHTSEEFLTDPDKAYDEERQQELEEAKRKSARQRVVDNLADELAGIAALGRRQIG